MWTDDEMDEYSDWLAIMEAKTYLAVEAGAQRIEHVISYVRARLPENAIIDREYIKHVYQEIKGG